MSSQSSDVFGNKCIFCPFAQRKINGKCENVTPYETYDAQNSIIKAAEDRHDQSLPTAIGHIDFIAKAVKYHHSCRKNYLADSKRVVENKFSGISVPHAKAFAGTEECIDNVIKDKGGIFLTTLHKKYLRILSENGISECMYSAQSVPQKICTAYNNNVNVDNISNKLGTVIFCPDIDIHEA
jgi:hypothetical protein